MIKIDIRETVSVSMMLKPHPYREWFLSTSMTATALPASWQSHTKERR